MALIYDPYLQVWRMKDSDSGGGGGGGTQTDFYKCASVTSGGSTWTGYKAVFSNGAYSFESSVTSVTSGLNYTSITPAAGGIYTPDALVEVQSLAGTIPEPVFFDALDSSTGWTVSGGTVVSDAELGKSVFAITSGGQYFVKTSGRGALPYVQNDRTMSFWARRTGNVTNGWAGIGYGGGYDSGVRFTWGIYNDYPSFTAWEYDYFQTSYGKINDTHWHHYLLTLSGGNTVKLYTDGVLTFTWTTSGINTKMDGIQIGDYYEIAYAPLARFSTLRIYNRVLNQVEINALAAEFTPTA